MNTLTKTRKFAIASGIGFAFALSITPASAHGFGERYDLPLPLNYFIIGATLTIVLSFIVIGVLVRRPKGSIRYPRYNILGNRNHAAIITNGFLLALIRVCSVAVFTLIISTALFGTDKPTNNLSPIFVWVIWWVGLGYISAWLGNVWMLLNPWKIVFEWAQSLTGNVRTEEKPLFKYPEWLDMWPSILLFMSFVWIENVYSGAASPQKLGTIIGIYSIITWVGMIFFGKHKWLAHGEMFSVLFGLFSKFSPTEIRVTDNALCRPCPLECGDTSNECVDCYKCFESASENHKQLNLRPFAIGLITPVKISNGMVMFIILALSMVTFDGLQETSVWYSVQNSIISFFSALEPNTVDGLQETSGWYSIQNFLWLHFFSYLKPNFTGIIDTLGVVLFPMFSLTVFITFSWGIKKLSLDQAGVSDIAANFVLSLIPIALAYNLAHYASLLLIQGQLIIPLASDPFGAGADFFGTSSYQINIGVINAKFIWFLSVIAIVVGHVISVYTAHIVSLTRVDNYRSALRGQYAMLVLMVLYTASSLWIIAQPITN